MKPEDYLKHFFKRKFAQDFEEKWLLFKFIFISVIIALSLKGSYYYAVSVISTILYCKSSKEFQEKYNFLYTVHHFSYCSF